MSEYLTDSIDPDFDLVTPKARILAINARHGFINIQHFFVAMMVEDCKARPLLSDFNLEIVVLELNDSFPATGIETMNDSVPLTVEAERLIHHAILLASQQNQLVNSIHVLLAMLSYDNSVSELLKKRKGLFSRISATNVLMAAFNTKRCNYQNRFSANLLF